MLFWWCECVEKRWGAFLIVENLMCSETEPSGLVWEPRFREVDFTTYSEGAEILWGTWFWHLRCACQVWTIFNKGGKICHVRAFFGHFRRKKMQNIIAGRNRLKFCVGGLHVVGRHHKKIEIIPILWRCSRFTKWRAWEKGSGVQHGFIGPSARWCNKFCMMVYDVSKSFTSMLEL